MSVVHKPAKSISNENKKLSELGKKIYTDDEISNFKLNEAINDNPLSHRPTSIRSSLAYKEILHNGEETSKYLLPGQIVLFEYEEPKLKTELEYYDRYPLVIFLGITRTKDNVIREIGLNLHYFPPFARAQILNHTYEVFKPYFNKNFNEASSKPNTFISWERLKHIMSSNVRLAFGIKMYIPVLRGRSILVPTRLLPIAYYTEGKFSQATLSQIFKFWRQFKRI